MGYRTLQRSNGARLPRRSRREPDLTSLINIIFLILIFFVVAGSLRPFSARDIELTKVARESAAAVVPSRLIIHRDGRIRYGGQDVSVAGLSGLVRDGPKLDMSKPITIVADGRVEGSLVLEVSRALRNAGLQEVSVMVERARK